MSKKLEKFIEQKVLIIKKEWSEIQAMAQRQGISEKKMLAAIIDQGLRTEKMMEIYNKNNPHTIN